MFKTKIMMGTTFIVALLFLSCMLGCRHAYAAYPNYQAFTSSSSQSVSPNEILKNVEKHMKYAFLYDGNLDLSKIHNIKNLNNKSINEILNEIFKDSDITYEVDGKQVILKKKQTSSRSVVKTDDRKIRGVVLDAKTSEPVIGAGVVSSRTGNGTVTNLEGEFSVEGVKGEEFVISCIGYEEKKLKITDINIYTVELSEDATALDEVVVTAFGVAQKKENMVGAIEQIRPDDMKVPSAQLTNAFAGRLAGVIAVQRSGEPGADGSNFWIRGKSTFSGATGALIIIDGMQASSAELNALDPEVIDSFSILKDATATAMYGTLGANGVMVVTTKQGDVRDKPIINFRLEGSMSQLTRVPKMVGGVEFMQLYNEAESRPDSPIHNPYSEERIQGTMDGIDPFRYPNIDWYDELFNNQSWGQKVNLNVRGGGKKANYFSSVSIKHNNGNLKSLSKDYFSYNNNIDVVRYDFVNNVNINLTKTTIASLGLNLAVQDYNGPSESASSLFNMVMKANPVSFPILFPAEEDDPYIKWGGMSGGAAGVPLPNPVAKLVSGSSTRFTNTVTANLKLEQKLDMLTKGLSAKASLFFKNNTFSSVKRTAGYNQFEITNYDDASGDYELSLVGNEQDTNLKTSANGNGGSRKLYLQAIVDYNRTFNKLHDVNAMFLYNQQQDDTNTPNDLYSSLPRRKMGIAGRISYGYDNRYMVEANFGYNGSENFAKGNRFGFFPSIGLGYNIAREKFWKPIKHIVNKLKLRASWGLVGNDNTGAGRFAYMQDLVLNGSSYSYSTGVPGSYTSYLKGYLYNRYYNPELTWEVGEKINLGANLELFQALSLNVEWFRETRRNIFQQRKNTTSGLLGVSQSKLYGNIGKMRNEGLDLSLDFNKQFDRDFYLSFKGTFTYAHNTVLEHDEPDYVSNPNLSIVGGSIGRHLVYVANGLFPDQETIDANPTQTLGANPIPGDLWYQDIADVNGYYNGIIDSNDRVYMGNPRDPEIVYGFGPSMKYKNWDFSFFFQGVARTSLLMSGFYPFGNLELKGVPEYVAENRWTVDNPNPNAEFPRLKIVQNENNAVASSYWLRDASFLKLKNVEVGYTYKKMRFYLSGANLATFSDFKYWDPEMGGGNGLKYPTQRTVSLGFQMTIN